MIRDQNTRFRTGETGPHPGEVVAVCISTGGVPKYPVAEAELTMDGLVGDGHAHDKHRRSDRAVSLQDIELLEVLLAEGYQVGPGIMGENITVRGLNVQGLSVGDRLYFENGPVLELTAPRKPCYVLDVIHPNLKDAVIGRCGYLARVVQTGQLRPEQGVTVARSVDA